MNASAHPDTPLVTAVIPAYNAAAFVDKAIHSILAQDYKNIEIVVVNDCSKDNTQDVLEQFERQGLIKIVRHEKNRGLPGARNSGIRFGSGDYFAFLDADDLWLPHHVSTAIDIMESRKDIAVVLQNFDVLEMRTNERYGDWFTMRRKAFEKLTLSEIAPGRHLIEEGLLDALLKECLLHMQAIIGRRPIFEQVMFDESIRRSEDLDWAIRCEHVTHAKWACVPASSGIYYRHENTLTTNTAANEKLILSTELKLLRNYLTWPDLSARHRAQMKALLKKHGLELCYYAREEKQVAEAWRCWLDCLRLGLDGAVIQDGIKLMVKTPLMMLG